MEFPSRERLAQLIEHEEGPCVSVFMPTHKTGRETLQNPIRFKNLIRKAQQHPLVARQGDLEKDDFLQPARDLLQDDRFWQHQERGLALFIAPGFFWYAPLPLRLEELLVVADRFHIKPLIPLLSGSEPFYILALSQGRVRFFRADRYTVSRVKVPDLPESIDEVFEQYDSEKQLQFHTGTPGGFGKRSAMFHGHGLGKEETDERLLEYFRRIDRALQEVLRCERSPLVLFGLAHLVPIYRKANSYPYVLEDSVPENPEPLDVGSLHEKACGLLQDYFLERRSSALRRYQEVSRTERAARELKEIVPAAYHGRVDSLFVALGVQRWGTFDPEANRVSVHTRSRPGDRDLLDLTAAHTLLNGGTVHAVQQIEMPEESPIAALFRY